jgi:hypothetical protein
MVALAVSTILVTMVLSVFARMSAAYRRQQQVATLQLSLSAAHNMIAQDARQAGFQMTQGFTIASDLVNTQRPVRIINSNAGPDEVRFFSADASVQARVVSIPGAGNPIDRVDLDNNQFAEGDLAVIVNTGTTTVNLGGGDTRTIAMFRACVVLVHLTGNANRLRLETSAPWGNANNSQCNAVRNAHFDNSGSSTTFQQTMIYRFRARAYRLDPTRLALGVLQVSPSGALVANDWQDLGVGFSDLQVAARMFIETDSDNDVDTDGSDKYDWYSGGGMTANTAPSATALSTTYIITRLTVSLAARTDRSVDGVASAATPDFNNTARPNFNNIGDHASVLLPNNDRVYRYSTNRIDMRNTGAGL